MDKPLLVHARNWQAIQKSTLHKARTSSYDLIKVGSNELLQKPDSMQLKHNRILGEIMWQGQALQAPQNSRVDAF